jgi:predicted ATPase
VSPFPVALESRLRLRRSPDKYLGLFRVFAGLAADPFAAERGGRSSLRFEALLARVLPDLSLASVSEEGGDLVVRLRRSGGEIVRLDELTDSERALLLFVLTFARFELQGSVVLCDTPELHLGPEDAARVVGHLAALGPDNQIIVATGSPPVLLAAERHQILELSGG